MLDGGPDPPRGKNNFLGNVAAHCKVMEHYTARLTDRHAVLDEHSGGPTEPCRCRSPTGKGQFLAVVGAFESISVAVAFAATGIVQSPMTSCSRRDHSVCQATIAEYA